MYTNMDGLLNTLKCVHKMSVDLIKFIVAVQHCTVRCGGFSVTESYNGSEL